jgi:serine/threonine protein kinase
MSPVNSEAEYESPPDVAERPVKSTEMRVSQILAQFDFVQKHCELYDLPRFERDDMEIGEMIAYEGYSNIHEVLSFRGESSLPEMRYVLKNLNPQLDLVMEAHFLSSFDHKHVIQLRGWSAAGIAGFSETGRADGFFLIFDRLQETWSKEFHTFRGSLMKSRSLVWMQLFNERLQVAVDIASAVEFLHSKRIIYRDLKPANIGFCDEGVVKIFDFGLAVELPEGSEPNSTFNLAGNTGTSRCHGCQPSSHISCSLLSLLFLPL